MNGSEQEHNVELNYNQLLLNHIDRIGQLSVMICGYTTNAMGDVINTSHEKLNTFSWSIRGLENLIPKNLKEDFDFNKKVKKLLKEYGDEKENIPNEKLLAFWMSRFSISINLLAENGFLYDTDIIVTKPTK